MPTAAGKTTRGGRCVEQDAKAKAGWVQKEDLFGSGSNALPRPDLLSWVHAGFH